MKKVILAVLFGFALSACASTGTKVDQSKLSQFEIGKSTKVDVIDALGKPDTNILKSDGTYRVIYTYSHAQVRAESLIPYVGLFTGGHDIETTSVIFEFDKRQVLTSYESHQGEYGIGYGLAGQKQ